MSDDDSIGVPRRFAIAPVPRPLDPPPPSVRLTAEFGACSDPGPLRAANDEHYLIVRAGRQQETLMTSLPTGEVPMHFGEYGYGMIVADGMGAAGEAASRLAISTLAQLSIDFGKWNLRINEPIADEVMDRAERFYRTVDSILHQASHDSSQGLQTTLTAVYSVGADLFFAHVGNSRAYMFRDGELMQLTRDHEREDTELTDSEATADIATTAPDLGHIVAEALGRTGSAAARLDIERCGLLDGDVVLLCTKGLPRVAADASIADVLRSHGTPDDQCRALANLTADSAGPDGVTVLVAHYHISAVAQTADVAG